MRRFVLSAAMGLGTLGAGTNQWASLGPYGGGARAVVVDQQNPATLYAVTSGGIFKSTDAGANWGATGPVPMQAGGITMLAIAPQTPSTLYTCSRDGDGVFKTIDGGATWKAVNSGLIEKHISFLAVDPQNASTVYAASLAGVFKTTNGGAIWNWVWVSGGGVDSLAIDPQNPRTIYADIAGGVFKSRDAGTTWNAVNSGLPNGCGGGSGPKLTLVIDPQNPATLLHIHFCNGVFKSTDGGGSWSAVNSGLPTNPHFPNTPGVFGSPYIDEIRALAMDPQNSTTVYAATMSGVYKTTDGGANWNAASSGLTTTAMGFVTIDPKGSGTLYAGTNDPVVPEGLFKSTDGAATWNSINSRLSATSITAVAIGAKDQTLVYANVFSSQPFLADSINTSVTADGGSSWNRLGSINLLAIDPQDADTLFANRPDGLSKSTDGGKSWTPANTGLPHTCDYVVGVSLAIDPQDTSTLYAALLGCGQHLGGVWKSSDGGANWAQLDAPPSGGGFHSVAVDPQNRSTLYAWNGKGLFKSADGGASWNEAHAGYVNTLIIDPQSPATLYAGVNNGLLKSSDGGASWIPSDSGLAAVRTLAIDPHNISTLYAGTSGSGVFRSTDGGATWAAVNSGLSTLSVTSLALDPRNSSTVYAGTAGGGVFVITFDERPL